MSKWILHPLELQKVRMKEQWSWRRKKMSLVNAMKKKMKVQAQKKQGKKKNSRRKNAACFSTSSVFLFFFKKKSPSFEVLSLQLWPLRLQVVL